MMTRRERVERAMAGQETDRIPVYDLLRNDAAFEHFSGEKLPRLSADQKVVNDLERIAAKAVGAFCDMTRSVGFGPVEEKDTTDQWGFSYHSAPFEKTSWILKRPFADEAGAAAFLKKYIAYFEEARKTVLHDPSARREQHHKYFLGIQARIGDTVNLLDQHGTGLDSISHYLGLELFSYLMADDPGLVSEALETVTNYHVAVCHAVADVKLSPAVLTYGDIACKQRLLYSAEFLRREFFPRLKRLNDAWHEHGFKCLFHSDGFLMEVMDDLVATGIDGLNPIETVAGMNLREVRRKYKKLFLAGGIDMSQLLSNGTSDQVREVCRQAIRDASPGYLMGSTTEADNSCKLENLIAMREVAMDSEGL